MLHDFPGYKDDEIDVISIIPKIKGLHVTFRCNNSIQRYGHTFNYNALAKNVDWNDKNSGGKFPATIFLLQQAQSQRNKVCSFPKKQILSLLILFSQIRLIRLNSLLTLIIAIKYG